MKQFSFILLVLILLSCGKKVTVKGRVYNPIDNKGIEGVDVQLSRSKVGFFSYDGAGSKVIENTTTDQDGNYLIDYRHNNRSFRLFFSVDEEKYINTEPVQYNISQQNNTIDLPLVPLSFLKLKINNVNCEGEGDEMQFRRIFMGEPVANWSSKRENCYFYESPEYFDVPMGWVTYEWKGIKSGQSFYYKDSIYLDKEEKGIFEILY